MKISNNDQALATRSNHRRLAVSALADEITRAFEDFKSGADEVVELALSLENRRIKLGVLLLNAKELVGHGGFTEFVEKSLPFSLRQGQRFMKHATAAGCAELKTLDDLRSYNALLVDWGLKEEPDGHGPQTLHDAPNFFAKSVRALGSTRSALDELFEHRPLNEWNSAEKEQLAEQLKPVAEVYNRIKS